jgi:hypothetical protein
VKEQSHKSEMRAAVRGDFERLRARRGEATLQAPRALETDVPEAEPATVKAEAEQAGVEQVEATEVEVPAPADPLQHEPEPARQPSSWLARLGLRR